MGITSLVRPIFKKKYEQLHRSELNADQEQQDLLLSMVHQAENTEWGRTHGFASIKSYDDFCRQVPVSTYEELKGFIDRMRHGEKDVLWPGKVKWYAKSSGTTNDKSKFIPVSKQGLKDTHYKGRHSS